MIMSNKNINIISHKFLITSLIIISLFNISTFNLWHIHNNSCSNCCAFEENTHQQTYSYPKDKDSEKQCQICNLFHHINKDFFITVYCTFHTTIEYTLSIYKLINISSQKVFLNFSRAPPKSFIDIN